MLLSLCNSARAAAASGSIFDCLMCAGAHQAGALRAANCSTEQFTAFCQLPRETYVCDAVARRCGVARGGKGNHTDRAACEDSCSPPSPPRPQQFSCDASISNQPSNPCSCVGKACCRCSNDSAAYNPAPNIMKFDHFHYALHVVHGAGAGPEFPASTNVRCNLWNLKSGE
jgi:hypothetical protein